MIKLYYDKVDTRNPWYFSGIENFLFDEYNTKFIITNKQLHNMYIKRSKLILKYD